MDNLASKPHNLPPQPTLFVGRKQELADISKMLANPACRLLTLIGPGGIGKTRLSIESARNAEHHFAQGVYFVSLQSIESLAHLVSAIADALQFLLSGQEPPERQLLGYLQNKQLLLLLDNFESLFMLNQDEGAASVELLANILAATPNVKLLVTSREVLNLQEEWIYSVHGLPYPPADAAADKLEDYGAVKLFAERVRRVRQNFSLSDEYSEVSRICRLVEGMPLGLELAATWAKTMDCSVIAAEIQRNIDFLASTFRNVPERQRSIRAIFDQSWQMLSGNEQNVFMRLSVFKGGFKHQAAERVAGASLAVLSALVDKSLLRWDQGGRYHIHELLRQYAAEQLAQSLKDVTRIYDLHSSYYAGFLQQRELEIFGSKQPQVVQEIVAEWENIRAAWQWAVNQANVENIQQASITYYNCCDFQGRYREATDAFEWAISGLNATEPNRKTSLILALLHVFQGWNYIRLGHFDKAQTNFEQGQTIYHNLDTESPPGFATDPLTGLAFLAHIVGNYDESLKLGEAARHKNKARDDKLNLQVAYYVLGNAALAQGNYKTAEEYLQQAYTLTQQTGNNWMMAYVLNELGNVARGLRHFEQARHHYQAGYQLKEALNDPDGKASALNNLAQVAVLEENYTEAKRLYQQSLSIYQNINDRGGLATSLNGLGMAECALGNCEVARPRFQQALQITTDMQFVPLTLSILIGIGELLLQTGRAEFGVELLTLALHHPAGDRETKDRANKCLDYFQTQVSADIFEAATQRGQTANLQAIIPTVQVELSAPVPASEEQISNEVQPQSSPNQSALVEPLTPRELEVLQLMAEGRTNQQIADELIISVGTAKWYTSEIYGKLGVNNRTQAVACARELKLLVN